MAKFRVPIVRDAIERTYVVVDDCESAEEAVQIALQVSWNAGQFLHYECECIGSAPYFPGENDFSTVQELKGRTGRERARRMLS